MIKLSERDITRQIRTYLQIRRVFHWKVHQSLGSAPGIADILGIYRGKFLAIEVKTDRGALSHHQQAFLENVKREGGIAIVARSVDDVVKGLA